LLVFTAWRLRDPAERTPPNAEKECPAVIHPMQYELERAYHTTRQANAARHRQVSEAEQRVAADPRARLLVRQNALQLWARLMPALRASVAE
jgi:hypothetical protein